MKSSATVLAACFLSVCLALRALDITADFSIVTTGAEGAPEEMAPGVLKEHLDKIFGRDVRIIPESEWNKETPAILLKRDNTLDKEEWNIESDGRNLTISGGWPRGLFYGVCEFLDTFGGVRWFTAHETKIPKKESITVPDGQPFRRKPAFPLKRIVRPGILEYPAYNRSRAFLKLNSVSLGGWPSLFQTRGTGLAHNFWKLTKAVPEGREDMLPESRGGLHERGRSEMGPNQVCFSNPEFREVAKKEVAKWIAEEEKLRKTLKYPDANAALWIELSQNDVQDWCHCKGCGELIRKYGSISGAMLEFINDVASAFPDHLFQTFAYGFTQDPPKGIQARDNVMIQMAFLTGSDLLRPMSHPNNETIRKQYDGWRDVAKHKSVWAYHRLYHMSEAFPWPQCCFWYIADNIRYYHNYGAEKIYLESECTHGNMIPSRAFHDLHNYLECKLMDNPELDAVPLIEEFFQFQYGPAVEEMKAYASYLRKRIDAVPGIVSEKPLKARGLMDAEFFVIVNTLLDRAEAKAGNDSGLLTRIAMERIPVDYAALEMWKQGGSACGLSRDEVIDRLEKCLKLFFERCNPEKQRKLKGKTLEQWEKESFDALELMRHPLPVPAEFENEDVIQIPVYGTCKHRKRIVQDPDAAFGTAVKLGSEVDPEWDHTKYPMLFGIYDHTTETSVLECVIPPENVPQDEAYHLYLIGRHVPNGWHQERLYGHRSWDLRIAELYKNIWDPMDDAREYDIYISCKMTGPAYVKGSTKENAVYVDKLLAVRRGFRKNPPAEPAKEKK